MKKKLIFLASFIPLLIIVAGIPVSSKLPHQKSKPYSTAKIEIKTFRNDCRPLFFLSSPTKPEAESWGYDIYLHGVLYVHQPYIPGIDNNQGFKKEEDAMETARLAAHKIRNNRLPLNISVRELESLKIIK